MKVSVLFSFVRPKKYPKVVFLGGADRGLGL